MSAPLRIFIGYDHNEIVAYHTLAQSITDTASRPVSLSPLNVRNLRAIFDRPTHLLQSTEFSFSRFLTPHLSNFEGWSLFMDCDMLVYEDIANLFDLADDRYAVMVCKHDYVPNDAIKFLGQQQTRYEKKNWSSLVLFNNAKCRRLTPAYVNTATGLELHQFKWLDSDDLIGDIPLRWNHLVGEYDKIAAPANVHFTVGGPYFDEFRDCHYAADWFTARDRAFSVRQR
jgi:hypothetical protein